MDMKLRQREEQVVILERELDKQRELREAQVKRESCVSICSQAKSSDGTERRGEEGVLEES